MMLLTFCSKPASVVFVNLLISLRVVSDVCESGINAVLMNENIKCMIVVAGLISRKYEISGSPFVCCSAFSCAL
jgi:hypothetical protein